MKRDPTSKVRETQDGRCCKRASEGRHTETIITENYSQSNHTKTTALSNSMKLSHALWGHQYVLVMVERFDRMWSSGEGNAKPLLTSTTP